MPQPSNQLPEDVQNAARAADSPTSATEHGTPPEPSGVKGDNPATAGPGETKLVSQTPENARGHLNPSAPEDSNATPGSTTVK